jgi:hypothetical protein
MHVPSRGRGHIGDGEGTAGPAGVVPPGAVPKVIVDEEHLASESRKRQPPLLRARPCENVGPDGSAQRCREAAEMAAVDYLHAPRFDGSVVEGRPELQLRIAVEPPETAPVLVPRELRSAARPLGEERGAVDRHVVANDGPYERLEHRVLYPGLEHGVAFEFLDLSVRIARPNPAAPELEVLVPPRGRVVLEEEALVHHAPGHDVLGARAQTREVALTRDAPKTCPSVFPPVLDRVV